MPGHRLSLRAYLIFQAWNVVVWGKRVDPEEAVHAVSLVGQEHPELDLSEKRTWSQWESMNRW